MRKLPAFVVLVIAMLLCLGVAAAQETKTENTPDKPAPKSEVRAPEAPKPLAYYRLDFTVNELDEGRKVNSRSYTMVLEVPGRSSFSVGSRVPVPTGASRTSSGDAGSRQYQYMDVGVTFDFVRIAEKEGLLVVDTSGEVSSLATEAPSDLPPVVRRARFAGPAVVTPGKTTVLFGLDDVNSKHRFQIELTATKLK